MILDIGNRPVPDLSADKEGEIDKNKTGETIFLYILSFFSQSIDTSNTTFFIKSKIS